MRNISELLFLLAGQKIAVTLSEGKLKVEPASLLTGEIREKILANKAELLCHLSNARQHDPADPGRMWAPNNPFLCQCGFSTGWQRDGKPLCPACDGKPPAGMPEGPRLNDVDPGIPSTGPCLICGVQLDQDGGDCWHRLFHLRTTTPAPPKPRNVGISPIALSWLRSNKAELHRHGWRPSELWRRNKSKGIAWAGVWNLPGLSVTIESAGSLSFHFLAATGQTIKQTAWPKRTPPKRSTKK